VRNDPRVIEAYLGHRHVGQQSGHNNVPAAA